MAPLQLCRRTALFELVDVHSSPLFFNIRIFITYSYFVVLEVYSAIPLLDLWLHEGLSAAVVLSLEFLKVIGSS